MSDKSPESASQAIAFGYVNQHPNWSPYTQRKLIRRYHRKHLPDTKLVMYEEGPLYRRRPFFERPMGHTIFVEHSNPGDHLIVIHTAVIFSQPRDSIRSCIEQKITIHRVTRKRGRRVLKHPRESYKERERKRKGVPLGWIMHDGRLVPDILLQSLGKLVLKMTQFRLRIPKQAELIDLAFAAQHGFPQEQVPADDDWRRSTLHPRIHDAVGMQLLSFLESRSANLRSLRLSLALTSKEVKKRIHSLRTHKHIKRSSVTHAYEITVSGRDYLRSLRERSESLSSHPEQVSTDSQDPTSTETKECPSPLHQLTEPSLLVVARLGDLQRRRKPRNSAPVRHGVSLQLLTPTPADPADLPEGLRNISLGFSRQPTEPSSESSSSGSDSSCSSDGEYAQ